jgi:hypothetical protein
MSPLLRLSRVLEERGVPLMPALQAVELSGKPVAFVAFSALHPRAYLLFPYSADLLEAVAPGASAGTLPARPMVKVYIDGDQIDVSLVAVGDVPPSEAVEVAPPGSRAAWLDIVTEMPALATGRVTSRMRYLTQERATIGIFYDRRTPDVDARLMTGIDQLAGRLGVPPEHRELWEKAHLAMGGGPVTVTTACTTDGPAPELTFLYREADWDQAVDLCKYVTSPEVARGGAAVLGSIAGTLELEKTEGTELVFAAGSPDVVVWLLPAVRYA